MVDSIILQTFAYGDTSKILRLLTADHGVCSAFARGALRPRSRFGGVLEPFSEGVATLYLKEGRE
ncbi:MAG: DNA repair protein RecO, partial [Planctomycetaceae bacterium]